MNCPNCGAAMNSGFLVAESLIGRHQVESQKTRLAVGGTRSWLRMRGATCTSAGSAARRAGCSSCPTEPGRNTFGYLPYVG